MSFSRWLVMGRKDYSEALITVVRLQGVLQASTGAPRSPQARRLINMDRVEKWFNRSFYKGIKPAACAITINSPGGSAAQAEQIHSLVRRLSKQSGVPVFTFAEDVAASGGYWLMCAGDKAYACETSLVGSIGVISSTFGLQEVAKRWGIERRTYTAGEAKVQMDPFLPVQPEQEARLRDLMADLHNSFKDRVRQSRGGRLKGNEEELFSGRAWTGRQALQLGLVDGLGDMRGVMQEHYGDKARFLLCSDKPQTGLADMLGLRSLLPGACRASLEQQGGSTGNLMDSLFGQYMSYSTARCATQAVLDEMEERAAWAPFQTK